MVLRMTRPHKRSDSSFLFYRKRVPDDLRAIIGKTEIKISLRTRDPVEAKIAHAKVAAEVEARWARLRRGVISVSQKQAVAMAGEIYRELLVTYEENPGEPGDWKGSLLIDWGFLRPEKNIKVHMMGMAPDESQKLYEKMRLNRHGRIVQDYLDRNGYRVDSESLIRIKKAANDAIMQGREQLLRNAEGDYRPDPDAERFPQLELTSQLVTLGDAPPGQASPLDVFDINSRNGFHSKPCKPCKAASMR